MNTGTLGGTLGDLDANRLGAPPAANACENIERYPFRSWQSAPSLAAVEEPDFASARAHVCTRCSRSLLLLMDRPPTIIAGGVTYKVSNNTVFVKPAAGGKKVPLKWRKELSIEQMRKAILAVARDDAEPMPDVVAQHDGVPT